MSCSGLANVLSGVALILRTSSGPTFRADHTVIGTGHHRLSIGTIRLTSTSDHYQPTRRSARPANGGSRRNLAVALRSGEGPSTIRFADFRHCAVQASGLVS